MNKLYPLKFTPIYKHKIWGGTKLKDVLKKDISGDDVGESWEISGVQDNLSVVANGFLAGNNLQELIEVYMGDLVGEKIYEKFGIEFPLLIKFIDANDILSVQVHPDDEMAKERHHSYGKTEMWYVIEAEKDAELIAGFNRPISKEEYVQNVKAGSLEQVLNSEKVKKGSCLFMPAGRVHAIGSGVLVAEIQQTSDITYRIFDWNRKDSEGKERELHTDLALEAIDFSFHKDYMTHYDVVKNQTASLVQCPYFTTNFMTLTKEKTQEYHHLDSFVIYMCVDGEAILHTAAGELTIAKGETVLIPANVEEVTIKPQKAVEVLEIYIS